MPHRVLERQYQRQAQKRHEQHLRQDYYERTARYFERESQAARHYSSWCERSPASYSDWKEKTCKAERLKLRQEKLRQLLDKENEEYIRELEEKSRSRRRRSDSVSLDQLRRQLLEKKAEQSLYYPYSCRRLRSYFPSPSDQVATKLHSLSLTDSPRYSGKNLTRYSSPSLRKIMYESNDKDVDSERDQVDWAGPPAECNNTNRRFAAHAFHHSLEGTNLGGYREYDATDARGNSMHHVSGLAGQKEPEKEMNYQSSGENSLTDPPMEVARSETEDQPADSQTEQEEVAVVDSQPEKQHFSSIGSQSEAQPPEVKLIETEIMNIAKCQGEEEFLTDSHRKGVVQHREADCAGTIDMSLQMYRYMNHVDLKQKILDLCKREHMFVLKQCWADALRLREMRNKLILLKNKNLYENHDLNIDEETRRAGLEVIRAREELNSKRARMCDSMMYSDEAKDIWKQCAKEDDALVNEEKNAMRDILLHELEEDWKQLATRDKHRVSQLFDQVMTKSDLQDEHKLAAVIRAANDGQKQYMNYLAT